MEANPLTLNNDEIRAYLESLPDEELEDEVETAHQLLFGCDALPEAVIQDDETLELLARQSRCILQMGGKILENRQRTHPATTTLEP